MSTYPTGCVSHCNGGADCTEAGKPCQSAAPEGGNVWFVGDEPPEPMTTADRIAVAALIAVSAGSVIGGLNWLNHIFN